MFQATLHKFISSSTVSLFSPNNHLYSAVSLISTISTIQSTIHSTTTTIHSTTTTIKSTTTTIPFWFLITRSSIDYHCISLQTIEYQYYATNKHFYPIPPIPQTHQPSTNPNNIAITTPSNQHYH